MKTLYKDDIVTLSGRRGEGVGENPDEYKVNLRVRLSIPLKEAVKKIEEIYPQRSCENVWTGNPRCVGEDIEIDDVNLQGENYNPPFGSAILALTHSFRGEKSEYEKLLTEYTQLVKAMGTEVEIKHCEEILPELQKAFGKLEDIPYNCSRIVFGPHKSLDNLKSNDRKGQSIYRH